ncbi:RNA-dependent RNA polymerase [Orthobunyavirus simbuense]|uniref:RNA-directed RNA polymerase L n=1 Tax=Simbu virus TaxID=3052441 RepID=J4F071_SIMBU|nr:RNA-dependent RNA polymerase [Orthobunyavirus simbuense]CCG93495.1 RNA-dependent RNA polymerase [Orthobunyavirus simbuense]
MDRPTINAFRDRINACNDPEDAKDIMSALLMARHDYFGKEVCYFLDIEYRSDVPASDIVAEVAPPGVTIHVRHCTPDNYMIIDDKLFIIDYKVSVESAYGDLAKKKYEEIFHDALDEYGIDFEVVIIRADPVRDIIHVDSEDFLNRVGAIHIILDFTWFYNLRALIYDKFKDNERFLEIVTQGEFTMTSPWIEEGTPELYNHPIFIEFYNSLDEKAKIVFQESIHFDATQGDKWNQNLVKTMNLYRQDYNSFVKIASTSVFKCTGNYPKPDHDEITEGWDLMVQRVSVERQITQDISKQKPSFHMIWSPPNDGSNENIKKILKLSSLLQKVSGESTYIGSFRAIGRLMDFSENVGLYESHVSKLKNMSRQTSKKIDKKLDEIKIGTSTILWEQQFKFDSNVIDTKDKTHLFKDFLGIGGHKQFNKKSIDDVDLSKPTILDFNDKNTIDKCKFQYKQVQSILSQENDRTKLGCYLEEYGHKISSCSADMWSLICKVCKMQFWSAVNDYSTLMKNMLAVSQYNRHNTFRVVTCANNSLFGIVMPSSDIKTKRATLVYFIIAIHDEPEDIVHHGALHGTFKSGSKFVSISKGMRLDKERCQRIVASPGLFLMTVCLMANNNPTIDLSEVCNFAFHTSLSITKAMLSLTEPSRYMIMNSLAISSHVKDYMAEKFSPYTKTSFSVVMANIIKKACYNANTQKDRIQLKNIHLTDYEITQKGVSSTRELLSIWFKGYVNLKEYINQIYMPFYFNSKGLHEKHHVMIDLAKTVLEIEKDQRENIPGIWSSVPKKQTANLPVLIYSVAKNLAMDTSRHNYIRSRIENANNLKRPITTISTFTSSKSCIKRGDFAEFKAKVSKKTANSLAKSIQKYVVANPEFADLEIENGQIRHAQYEDVVKAVPNYIDVMSTKVFDRLYELISCGSIDNKPTIHHILQIMKDHTEFIFTFFNKGQKTAKDREIFVGEFEAKMCLYLVERISKERCKLNPEEMISEPGDGKLKKLEELAESEIRYTAQTLKIMKEKKISEMFGGQIDIDYRPHSLKIEINADMSKWSAQDVLFKYFWLFTLDPALYRHEKERILYFLCNYMQKKLILPDELVQTILDQRGHRDNDLIFEMTNGLSQNWVEIKRNWLQGNLNYTSSYLHSCCMNVYKDVIKSASELLEGESLINSMVHSDDNHTSIVIIQDKLPDDTIIEFCIKLFEKICLTFGNQANMKKTYITNFIKEFVSLFNIYGEPFSVYGRFLLTAVGDCAYLGPYEDAASRLSATQTAIKHGCPGSLAWISIALNQWITHTTYNMLPGQNNDPCNVFPTYNRQEIPIELCGLINADLSTIAIAGLESGNLEYLVGLSKRMSSIELQREPIQSQYNKIEEWNIDSLTPMDRIKLKLLRFMTLDSSMSSDDGMGETSDMRSRSLLTPRKFTTNASLIRLKSYNDYQQILQDKDKLDQLFEYFVQNPQLLVTKGETVEEFCQSIRFRYSSRKFKESLSIQNPAQLFIEQILFANKPMIDYTTIHDKLFGIQDDPNIENATAIIGKKTFPETYKQILLDLERFELTVDDVKTVFSYCLMNDPILIACANNILISVRGMEIDRTAMTCSTMPEIKSLKVIYHTPALVLRAYVQDNIHLKGVEPDEMRRDLHHLEQFIEQTKLREHMRQRIQKNEIKTMGRDLKFEIRELTKFYQICYDYVKSTEHKVKIFILPRRNYTPLEFCGAVTGNLLKDDKWVTIYYLKQITLPSKKAQIASSIDLEVQTGFEAMRLIAHFADSFLSDNSRITFLKRMISDYTYKGVKVELLYRKLCSSRFRTKILPILFYMGDLSQSDIDRFDAEKAEEQITWNNWQTSREFTTGPIDLSIKGYSRSIRIVGNDNELTAAELNIPKIRGDVITRHGQALLNKPHGLKFENMKPVDELNPKLYYICYQLRAKKRYYYNILSVSTILEHNDRIDETRIRKNNKWVPVCPVAIGKFSQSEKPLIDKIKYLNMEEIKLTKLQIAVDDHAMIRKAPMQKMSFFEGPPIPSGGIDVSKLMQSQVMINLNMDTLSNISLLDLCRIFSCKGETTDQDAFEFLSDEIIDEDITEELDSSPALKVTYTRKSDKNNTYKNAIIRCLIRESDKFESCFDISDEGFTSDSNLEILECLVWILELLKTNQWSTELISCIHMCLYRNNLDQLFHNFTAPESFVSDAIIQKPLWTEIIDFLQILQATNYKLEPWVSIMKHSISKAIEYAKKKYDEENQLNPKNLRKFIKGKKMGGKSKFEF